MENFKMLYSCWNTFNERAIDTAEVMDYRYKILIITSLIEKEENVDYYFIRSQIDMFVPNIWNLSIDDGSTIIYLHYYLRTRIFRL